MGKTGLIVIIVLAVVLIIGIVGSSLFLQTPASLETHTPVELDKESLPQYLSQQKVVQDMPDNANVNINFGDTSYEIVNGQLVETEGGDDSEIEISFPDEYIDRIGEVGPCQALKEARANGDVQVETRISNSKLAWKYRSMLKYRECFEIDE